MVTRHGSAWVEELPIGIPRCQTWSNPCAPQKEHFLTRHWIYCPVWTIDYRVFAPKTKLLYSVQVKIEPASRMQTCWPSRRTVPDPPHEMAMRSVIGRQSSPAVVDRRRRCWPPCIRFRRCPECAKKTCFGSSERFNLNLNRV